ncbi:MAG: hypothetical protein ACRDPZ_13940 [Gaiellaceae bacterium]
MTRYVVTTDDGVRLVGELVVPEVAGSGSAPAALVRNGSGPLDRDSNVPDLVLDIANTLASALAEHGVFRAFLARLTHAPEPDPLSRADANAPERLEPPENARS